MIQSHEWAETKMNIHLCLFLQMALQYISLFDDSLYVECLVGMESPAQIGNLDVQRHAVGIAVVAPHLMENLLTENDFIDVVGKYSEYFRLAGSDDDTFV